jgi:hypothetical protein
VCSEEIEAHAEEIKRAEGEAMRKIAALMRDLAVELPHESKLPVRFADTANRIDRFAEFALHRYSLGDLNNIVDEWGPEEVRKHVAATQAYVATLEAYLERRK